MKVLSLVGARPQFIKETILQQQFKKSNIQEVLVHSGQHYDVNMSDVFFRTLNIKLPDFFLNVKSNLHGEMTGKIMIEFEKVALIEKPDVIVVYGDTNTTLAGAVVSSKLKIPFAHVEAGIRMKPTTMPEEINRVLTDRIANLLFCPSRLAVSNLKKENITKDVFFTGDVMYDLFLQMKDSFSDEIFNKLKLNENKYVLVTLHRDYNVDDFHSLKTILHGLNKVNDKIQVVYPMHPRTNKRVKEFHLEKYLKNLTIIEPIDYLNLMGMARKCWKVITDSGGLQKEAYFARKQSIIVMIDTGWKELLGWNILTQPKDIVFNTFTSQNISYPKNLYGEGDAGEKIVAYIKESIK